MTKRKTVEEMDLELSLNEEKMKRLQEKTKILTKQRAEQMRKERTHRLCTLGGMLEGFLKKPELFTEDEVYNLLRIAFNQTPVNVALHELLSRKSKQEESLEGQEGTD